MSKKLNIFDISAMVTDQADGSRSGEVDLYGYIDYDSDWADFATDAHTATTFKREIDALGLGAGDRIQVNIQCYGGCVDEGIAMYNYLKDHPAHVTAKIMGIGASMGSVIPFAADEIILPTAAILFLHEPLMGIYGNLTDFEKAHRKLQETADRLAGIYAENSDLSKEEWRAHMKNELTISGATASNYGLKKITVVDAPVKIAACVGMLPHGDERVKISKALRAAASMRSETGPASQTKHAKKGQTMNNSKAGAGLGALFLNAVTAMVTDDTNQAGIVSGLASAMGQADTSTLVDLATLAEGDLDLAQAGADYLGVTLPEGDAEGDADEPKDSDASEPAPAPTMAQLQADRHAAELRTVQATAEAVTRERDLLSERVATAEAQRDALDAEKSNLATVLATAQADLSTALADLDSHKAVLAGKAEFKHASSGGPAVPSGVAPEASATSLVEALASAKAEGHQATQAFFKELSDQDRQALSNQLSKTS